MADPRCGIPRIWAAALSALRQWLTVCFARRGRAVEAVGKADQGRRHAGTHCAGQAATEWTARADAPDVIEGGRQSAGANSARADQAPAGLPASLQRSASAPGARQRHTGRSLYGFPASLRRRVARTRLWRRSSRQARASQRRDQVERQHDLHHRGSRRRADRSPRRRRGTLDRQLRADRARRDHSPRRSPEQTKTQILWTCGQREGALPTRPTGPATTDLNETRIVLPMSSVTAVTYVVGCSRMNDDG